QARFARIGAACSGFESAGVEQGCDALLLFFESEGLNDAREILRGKQITASLDRSDADGGEIGIEDVPTVAGGVHPSHVHGFGVLRDGDVFRDQGEVGTGFSGTLAKRSFAWVLMLEKLFLSHAQDVLARGGG